MTLFTNKIVFVVPTKDRPHDLRRMLASVQSQSVHPDQIIIVDGSEDPVKNILTEFSKLNTQYIRVYPPSLARQRNAGMAVVDPRIALAGYLDDDLVFEPNAMKAMLFFWENARDDVGGARFNIVNEELPRLIHAKSFFLIENKKRGEILRSGYQTSIGCVRNDLYVRWLSGGVTVWRRKVIQEFSYDEWFDGTGYLEDVDYSYRVGRKYKLAVVANARVHHLSPPVKRDKNFLLGKWQVINRLYFVRKYSELSVARCCWALCGQLLVNLGKCVEGVDKASFERVLGNLAGVGTVMRGRLDRVGGILK